jgi:hypothetical protein
MKKLRPITIGKYTFEVSAEHIQDEIIQVTVTCGKDSIARNNNHQGTHDHTDEQFDKDIDDFVMKIATELAGKIRSRELAQKFTKG